MPNKQHAADETTATYRSIEKRASGRTPHVIVLSCSLLIAAFGAWLCLSPVSTYSPVEKRPLTQAPALSLSSLADGSWTAGIATFCADQFPARSLLVAAKANMEIGCGKHENNEILKGKDGYLIPRNEYTEGQIGAMSKNITAVSRFAALLAAQDIPFTFSVAPRSVDVNTDKLPMSYSPAIASQARNKLYKIAADAKLPLLDLTSPLCEAAKRSNVWFKTDHHWTARGAYIAYLSLGDALGYTPYSWQDFDEQVAYKEFKGTSAAAFGGYGMVGEELPLARYEGDEEYQTEIMEGDRVVRQLDGFYDWNALGSGDEYSLFLGGTNTCIHVAKPGRENAPLLVILKDSFSQSLAPYLARHFDLLLIDPRTYDIRRDGPLIDRIRQAGADRVLLLYGIDTLCDSPSLTGLTYGIS